jgi:hypothetical protein
MNAAPVGETVHPFCKTDALFVLFKTLAERPEKNRDAKDEQHPAATITLERRRPKTPSSPRTR